MRTPLPYMVCVLAACAALAAEPDPAPPTLSDVMFLLDHEHLIGGGGLNDAALAEVLLRAIDPKVTLTHETPASTGDVQRAELWPTGIGYMKLNGLDEPMAASVVQTLRSWSGQLKTGLILDLRGSGGAELTAFSAVDGLFAQGLPVRADIVRGNGTWLGCVHGGSSTNALFDLPVVLLVDGQTYGVSEALVAVMKHYSGVLVIGTPTMGDRGLREWVTTQTGRKLYLATRWIDVCAIAHRAPVLPDVVSPANAWNEPRPVSGMPAVMESVTNHSVLDTNGVPMNVDEQLLSEKAAGDPVLRRALDVLKGLHVLRHPGAEPLVSRPTESAVVPPKR